MVKPVFRRKSIGTKISEEEYARLEAAGRRPGEARPADETVLAEVLALRTILLNAFSYDTRIARTFLAALATFSI